ncbi:MAG TPA: CarD family transcriptional regulator, partial [Chitinophagales bacterium]|nr:CarD family transcriptional regulator [Chitinophagales bacterium]
FRGAPQPIFNKNFELLIQNLRKNQKAAYKNVLFVDSPRQVNRIDQIFTDLKANVTYLPFVCTIHEGFIDQDLLLACYTDHQIFDRYHKYNIKQGYSKDKAISIQLLRSLQPGDYVTHIDHGVGVFSGLSKIEVGGKMQEVIRITYRDNDILYVGINSLHKVSKFVGKDGTPPKINKLGSDAWETVKRKAKQKIKDIAEDLIKLYAKRKGAKGFMFSNDTYLQTELEASFIYEDTPDQLKSTLDVKRDMEKPYPMDRLVCGDVGFGKTEIAVRAAAKAVTDSKQVAVLVPTTILALQHFQTFTDRLKNFPATIDYLNRFKTAKQKTETLQKLAEGKIDIVIGTHALLGQKVKFKDLGLLIIDEEQKFGVAAKEKLRSLKVNIDTLTLTATPIPRTLQFSLLGARDLSVMSTPPPNRQPVETEIIGFDEAKIREAINYEVYRGGQVFFIHNRVKDLPEVSNMIMKLCPDVSVATAHGQMDNHELEEKMLGFIEGKHDVLVSTNIVEAGLDVPNANTIIINHAHWFGLSDLHQLRGRVGRSNKKAFCYLISPALYTLPEDSRRRLKAIEQFAELGSGFQVAMRDLDIRGAGNLLGGEQSGFI